MYIFQQTHYKNVQAYQVEFVARKCVAAGGENEQSDLGS